MKWFYDLKIRTKLLVSFVLVAVIAGLVGVIGITSIREIQRRDALLYAEMTVPVSHLGQVTEHFHRHFGSIRDAIMADDAEEIRAAADTALEHSAAISKTCEELEKLPMSKEMRATYDEFLACRKAYAPYRDDLLALAAANKDQEATGLLNGAANEAVEAEQAAIDKLVELKLRDAQSTSDGNSTMASAAVRKMMWLIVTAVMVAIGLGIFMAGIIGTPLKKLSGKADQLALGDVDVTVEARSRDEIGDLMRSMSAMVANIRAQADTADQIASGDLSVEVRQASEKDLLAISMRSMVATLRELIAEAAALNQAAIEGRLEARGDIERFQGGYRDLIKGMNDTLDAIMKPFSVTAEYIQRISDGDIPEKISDDYNGDYNTIKENLNTCIEALDTMRSDVRTLCVAALEGRLDTRADASKHHGVYQKIIQGFNDTLNAVTTPVNDAMHILEKVAQGDLTVRVDGDYQGDHARIKDSVNSTVDALSTIIIQAAEASDSVADTAKELASTAQEVGRASQSVAETINQVAAGSQEQTRMVTSASVSMEQLSQAIEEVSKGAQSQAKTVEETVSLVQQITEAIDTVAKTAQAAASASMEVAEVAKSGGDSVDKSVEGMARIKETSANVAAAVVQLGENSKQIGAIVETIDDIAEQTNLLALNAAIEAARAGEHGKGFAVVADEVRKLAERSSMATKEIADLIGSIQQMTEHAVEAMQAGTAEVEAGTELANEAGGALGNILEAVNAIVRQIEDVSASTQEMSASSAEVARAVESLSAVTEQSTAATEQMAASATEVTRSVEQVAAVSEENAAAAEEVSAAAEEQNASVEEMSASAVEVTKIADDLQSVVARFRVDKSADTGTHIEASESDPMKKAA